MWLPVNWLLSAVVITGCISFSVAVPYCAKQNKTDKPRFTQELGSSDNVRLSHGIAILCCAEGYDNITWFREENNAWKSFPPPPDGDDNTPSLEEDGQILRIHDAKQDDQTTYRCYVKGKSKVLKHDTSLRVIECDPLARGPIPTEPFPENKIIYKYGGNITFHCTGYFGCQDKGDIRLVLWRSDKKEVQDVSPRYNVQSWDDNTQFTRQSDFTITDVKEEDTKRTFTCLLASPQEIDGQTKMNVRITKKVEPKVPWLYIGLGIGGGVLFLIFLVILLKCIGFLYGPQIRLYCSSRISWLRPKTIDKEQYLYNLYIYHASEDEKTAQRIKQFLQDRGYQVHITADMGGNQNVMHAVFEKCHQSAMVVFLYSDKLKQDNLANFFLQALINDGRDKDILFLEVAAYKPKEVMDWTRSADVNNLLEQDINQIPIANDINENSTAETVFESSSSITENDGMDENEIEAHDDLTDAKKTEKINDIKLWKVLKRIKFPDGDKNKRKLKNFWCSFENKIPLFEDQKRKSEKKKDSVERNNSLTTPLLDTCRNSEQLTPINQNGTPGQLNDEVFTYAEPNEKKQHLPDRLNKRENDDEVVFIENTPQEAHDNDRVRGELGSSSIKGRATEFIYAADVHNRENSEPSGPSSANDTGRKSLLQSESSYIEGAVGDTTDLKSREEVFTLSDEMPKPGSFESESGYSEGTSSGRGTHNTSESGDISRHELLSYKSSSGVSDIASEGSVSPQNQQSHDFQNSHAYGYTEFEIPPDTYGNYLAAESSFGHHRTHNSEDATVKGNGKLKIIINNTSIRNSSISTPESGYITSPSERTMSAGGFLPRKYERIDAIVEEQ